MAGTTAVASPRRAALSPAPASGASWRAASAVAPAEDTMRATITASKRLSLITMTLLLAPLGACSDPSGSVGPGTEPDPGAGGSGGQVTSSGGISSGGDIVEEPTYPMVEARNPNIWADVPDMAILRVGSTYYMSSTTMHMNPGVPIMRSEDLVNWEVVSYAHQALDANHPRLNMSNGQ